MIEADVLVEGGTIVDGTGAPGFAGSVAVVGDRLRVLRGDDGATGIRAGRRIDARGLVIAPGFIDLHSHGGLVMLAEPRHEPKVRQGVTTELIGVDGNAYAPFPSRRDLDDYVVLNAGLDGRPDIAYDWSTVAEYLARYDRRTSVNVAYVVGQLAAPDRLGRLGRGRGRPGRDGRPAGPAAGGDGGGRVRRLHRPRLPARVVRHDRRAGRAGRRSRPARRDLPHPRPVSARRRVPRPVPGGDRDRAALGLPGPHHPLLPPADVPRAARGDARPGRRRPGRGAGRHLRPVPVRVGEHPAPDHAAELDAGRRSRAAARAPGRPAGAGPDPRGVRGTGAPLRRRPVVGRGAPGLLRPPRERPVGGPDARRVPGRDGPGPGGRHLRPAARRGPADQPGDARAAPAGDRPVHPAPPGDGRPATA